MNVRRLFTFFIPCSIPTASLVALMLLSPSVSALTLSSTELAAAKQLGCVLAEDALGYLNEDQFNQRFDGVVDAFSEQQVDVIYAKALGYIDGLLFGVPSGESRVAMQRLQSYSSSEACLSGASAVANTVSL